MSVRKYFQVLRSRSVQTFSGWGWSWPPWRHQKNLENQEIALRLKSLIHNVNVGSTDMEQVALKLRTSRDVIQDRVSQIGGYRARQDSSQLKAT